MNDAAKIFTQYIREPGKFWTDAGEKAHQRRQVEKVNNRIASASRKRQKSPDQVIGDVISAAERRQSGHPPTVYVLGRGGAGSNWLAQMLGELRGYLNSGEVFFPRPLIDALAGLPAGDRGFVADCVHLLHAWGLNAARDLSESDLVNASLVNPAGNAQVPRNKEWEPQCFVMHLIRDPRDQVASVVFRKPLYRAEIASGMADWQYMSWTAERLRKNYQRIRSSRAPVDLTCKYEDVRRDPAAWLSRIVSGVGRPVPPAEIQRSIELHDAEAIRAGRAPRRGNLSSSEPKGWRAELNEEQRRLLHAELIEVIEDAGFPPDECVGHTVTGERGGYREGWRNPDATVPVTIYSRPGVGREWERLGDGKKPEPLAVGDMKIRIDGDLSETIRSLRGTINTQAVHGLCLAGNASVTVETLSDIAVFTGLRELDLARTGVSDRGLEVLGRLSGLAEVSLLGTRVSPKAVERFEKTHRCTAYLDRNLARLVQAPVLDRDDRPTPARAGPHSGPDLDDT